jgi:pimeloyl-ACP methyl ester carboxylesterase
MATVLKTVELPTGVTLPYVEHGDPGGAPLLFLHAIADSWHSFERVLPHLPDALRALVPTQRGHGDATRPPTGYRPQDFAADMLAFLDAVHVEAALLVGGSSGGLIARRFAMDHPERTLGLVLLGSPATLHGKPDLLELWDSTLSKLTDPIDPHFVREFTQSCIAQPVPAPFFTTLVEESLKVPARVWTATFKGLLEDESFQELGRVRAATLVAWGDQDAILPRSDQEALTAAIPNARLLIYPGAGHAFYWEIPERVADDIGACLTALGTPSDP